MRHLLSYTIAFCLSCLSLNATTFEEKVIDLINHSEEVSGLKAEEFLVIKPAVTSLWNELSVQHVINLQGADSKLRPFFVTLQGLIERVLANELNVSIFDLKAVIHTPMPATPLCTKGAISADLVDASIMKDPLRLFTVKARTIIIRDYLHLGGTLLMAYPKEGLSQRTKDEREIYQNELLTYPTHLVDLPLECDNIPEDLVGAFYLFKNPEDQFFVFAIKIPQANKPLEDGSFGLWFGPLCHPAIHDRISQTLTFLKAHSSHEAIVELLEVLQKEISAKL